MILAATVKIFQLERNAFAAEFSQYSRQSKDEMRCVIA